MPLFTRKRIKEGEEEAFRMAGSIWVRTSISSRSIDFRRVAMPFLVRIVAPGFGSSL